MRRADAVAVLCEGLKTDLVARGGIDPGKILISPNGVALGLFGVFPLAFVVVLTGLEIVIAFLQAFVFTILTCLYLNDALHLH